jgi:TonB-linked SusC/RagA family outer membrane protein
MRKKNQKRILVFLISIFSFSASFAQTRSISGTVTGNNGNVLMGATVAVKNSNVSTTTNKFGVFTLDVPANAKTLVISYVGMQNYEVGIGNSNSFKIELTPVANVLNNVVVIGYGTQKRGDVNGAIASISSKDIQDIPQASVDQMMQGKIAGVTITNNSGAPGAAVSVRVRGITSFGSSEPLYVIDGVAIDGGSAKGSVIYNGASEQEATPSPLAQLNPNDIASIDVLKDASATAIYGSRGANGVVIITTKKGKNGMGQINLDSWYGTQTQGKFINTLNLPQYAVFEDSLATLFRQGSRTEFSDPKLLGPGTNWQKALFRNAAPEQSHTVSFSRAKDGTDYYVSAGYFDQQGTIIGSKYNRYSLHMNVNSQVKSWFKVGTSFSANQSSQAVGVGNAGGLVYQALLQAPDATVYNADGSFAGPPIINGNPQGGQNPIQSALSTINTFKKTNVQGSIYGNISFNKDFSLHSEIDGNFDWNNAKLFLPTYAYGTAGGPSAYSNGQAILQLNNSFDTYWNWVEHLNYNHTFGTKHVVSALVGHEVWESNYDGIQAGTKNFTAGNTLQTLNLGDQSTDLLGQPKGSTSMESWLARVIYTYNDKYSITASDRSDRSSNFAQGHQLGYFPGVAVSWKISNESFMSKINNTVSNLKLRLGYGTTGNSNIPQYSYGSSIRPVVTGLGTGFSFNNFANPLLTWETAIQKDAGLDFSLFHGIIDASFDYYQKTSKNFLFQQPLPAFLGGGVAEYSQAAVVQPPYVNAGEIENKGFEFSITSHNVNTKDFKWNTNVIFSHYNNKVLSLNGFPSLVGGVSNSFGGTLAATVTQVGGPIGEFYGYKVKGIIKTQAQLLNLAQHPQNVSGAPEVITSDRLNSNGIYLGDIEYYGNNNGKPNTQYALGNPNPDFTYSITNTFNYKDFDLSIFLNGSYGGKILNALNYQTLGLYSLYSNQKSQAANFWTPSNPNTNIPTPRAGNGNNNLVMSDRFLESASYLKLQNVRLGYNLPERLSRKVAMSHLNVYVSGQNLLIISKYTGLDPEIGSLNQSPILQNIDYGRYPTPRIITFGLNAQF